MLPRILTGQIAGIGLSQGTFSVKGADASDNFSRQVAAADHTDRNRANAPVISREGGPVTVRVIRTDEEQIIARSVYQLLDLETDN